MKENGVESIGLASENLREFVGNLKKNDGKNIRLSGGDLAKSFLDEDFVD